MSLTTRIRSEIYQKLVPILGEENAEAMMAEFPATEHDQLVTREFLRAEMTELRGELKGEIGSLRSEMHSLATRNLLAMVGALLAGMGLAAKIG